LHAGFVLTGMVNTMLGPLLPLLSSRWGLTDAQAGYLFAAQFGASILGVMASSFLVPKRGSRLTLVLGLVIMGLGTAALAGASWTVGMLGAFGAGLGFGLTIPTTNLLVSELNPTRRAAALNLVNFSWGVGAVSCPFVIAGLNRVHRLPVFMYGMLGVLVVLAWIVSRSSADVTRASLKAEPLDPGAWRSKFVPVLAGIFFLYVGSEASVGGWIAAYARRAVVAGTTWVLTPSFFWATLLIGRAVAPRVLRRVPELVLARIGLVLAAIGVVGFLTAENMLVLGLSVALAGLGFSAVYPIAIAVLSQRFGAMAARIGGLLFSLAGLGGSVMPWTVGVVSTHFASLRVGLLVPLFGCVAMLVLYSLVALWSRRENRLIIAS
jgi:MFS transporter, FHS family, glucose/mannose:H+ symporter